MAANGKCESERLDETHVCDEVVLGRNLFAALDGIKDMCMYPDTLTSATWVRKVYLAYRAIERRKEPQAKMRPLAWCVEHQCYDEHGQ